jgi:hypothetical protein
VSIEKESPALLRDPMWFRKNHVLLEDGTPFGQKMEPWQEEDFREADAHPDRNTYNERPRGHSKTFDSGANIATRMVLGPPRQQLYGSPETCPAGGGRFGRGHKI